MVGAAQNNYIIDPLFEKFGKLGVRWVECFPETGNIPGDIRAALLTNAIVTARKAGNFEAATNGIRELLAFIPAFETIVSKYNESLQKEIESETAAAEFELEMQAEEFKRDIRDAIDMEDFDEARALIAELEKYVPDDPELRELKRQLPPMPKTDAADRFAALAQQVKQNIRTLIANGEFDQAQALLAEYEQLCPGDSEINIIRTQILAR